MMRYLLLGDCAEKMRDLAGNSIDAIVTDPPYGLAFMGVAWDTFGGKNGSPRTNATFDQVGGNHHPTCAADQARTRKSENAKFQESMTPIFAEALRVAKPGAHLLAFGGTRTYHRLACAIEDAGWEIRDCCMWVYGCLSEDTEILTCKGWAKVGTIQIGDRIHAYDRTTKTFRYEEVKDTFLYDYDDTAYRIQSDSTDQLVSRNHRVIVERGGVEVFEYAENLAQEQEACVPVLEGLQSLLDNISLLDKRTGSSQQNLLAGMCGGGKTEDAKETLGRPFAEHDLPCLRKEVLPPGSMETESENKCMFTTMQRKTPCENSVGTQYTEPAEMDGRTQTKSQRSNDWREKLGMERRSDISPSQRKLCDCSVCALPEEISANGSEGRICNGASSCGCESDWPAPGANGSCASHQSQPVRQSSGESNALSEQFPSQIFRDAWRTTTTLARITPVHYNGRMWCVSVPSGAIVARRNGKIFVTGNSGFPKSMDVAKAIDKSKGLKGEKIGERRFGKTSTGQASGWHVNHVAVTGKQDVLAPASDEAKQWNGWGTQTKPAVEPVIIAVKPYDGDIEKAINHLKSMEDKLCSSNVKDAGRSLRPSQAVSSGVKADSAPASVPTPQGEEKERLTTTGKVDDTASAADTSALAQETESIVLNTILLWRRTLEDAYALTNRFTTSMVSSLTIDLKTWSCFLLQTTLVDIVDLVTHQSRLNASALLAENYFFAISAKLNSIRTLTVAGNAISQNEISPHLRPIVVARKPLDGTVAANVLKYGTGAINIDGCRVPTENESVSNHSRSAEAAVSKGKYGDSTAQETHQTAGQQLGRFPANLIHDGSDEVLALFPDSKGALAPVYGKQGNQKCHTGDNGIYGHYEQRDTPMFPRNDSGSAARFFYCAKASRSERGDFNDHMTVKPLALMRYLVRLVTRKGGIVLDPFMGSGTTGVAAIQEGMNFIGIERDPHYYEIATRRISAVKPEPPTPAQQELPL